LFVVFFHLAMLPLYLIAWLLNPKGQAVLKNGEFHILAAIAYALIIIYSPFALVFAARQSNQLRGKP